MTNGLLSTVEGCASMSDQNGNLVLYSDGSTAWNSQHQVIANSTGMFGNFSATQSCIILKKPGSATQYYIFSQQGPNNPGGGCYYSVVDMSLAAGAGSVITKNVSLYQPSSEKLVATKHCNGIDFWIITRDANTSLFRCFLLTSLGVSATVVTSNAITPVSGFSGGVGYLKVSPNGRKLVNCSWVTPNAYDVYDFDNSTGLISNPYQISIGNNILAYGVEFSPDGTKLYGGGYSQGNVFQWDLCAGTPAAVQASSVQLYAGGGVKGAYQLAPDGKIYIARMGQQTLAVVNNPNASGTACGYVELGQSISPRSCSLGLPNIITSGLKPPIPPFTHTVSNSFGCQTAAFTSPAVLQTFTQVSCVASGYSLTGMQWNFGDPSSGVNNTSTLQNPTHAFTTLGTYTVSLVVYFSCGGGTDTVRSVVNINQPCISVSSTSITCSSLGSATVAATGGIGPYSYTWMPGNQTSSVATGLSPGSYTITVFDFGNNFTYTAQTTFNSLIPLTGSITASSSVSCFGASTGTGQVSGLSGGSGNQSFTWFNGSQTYTTAYTNSLSAGIWSINVTDALTGCQINQSFLISQPPAQNIQAATGNATICAGFPVTLSVTNSGGTPFQVGSAYTYSWSGLGAGNTATVQQASAGSAVYSVTARDSLNCMVIATVGVQHIANPVLSVISTSVCPTVTGTITVSGASNYTWTNGIVSQTGSLYSASPLTTSVYTVTGEAATCTSTATGTITVLSSPTAVISTNSPRCVGTNLQLSGSGGNLYQWSGPAGFNASFSSNAITSASLANAGVYNLTVTAANGCTASSSSTVVINSLPVVTAAGSTVCTTQQLLLYSNVAAGVLLNWAGPLNFSSNIQNPVIPNPTLARTGIYTVVATSTAGCSSLATATAAVLQPPVVFASVSPSAICGYNINGSSNSLQLSYGGASNYTLSCANLSAPALNGSPVTCVAVPAGPFVGGIYSGTVTGDNNYCASSASFSFEIKAHPSVTITPQNPAVCEGGQQLLTASGATAYNWLPATAGTLMAGGQSLLVRPISTSTYAIIGYSNSCSSSIVTTSVVVNPVPQFSLSPASPTVCLNETVKLQAIGNASSYLWSPGTGLSSVTGNPVNAGPSANTQYTVLGTLNNCTNTAVVSLSVMALPKPVIEVITPTVCLGQQIRLTGLGGVQYYWLGPGSFSAQGQYQMFDAVSPALAGGYTLMVKDAKGCSGQTTASVNIIELPGASVADLWREACVPVCSDFRLLPGDGVTRLNYQWQLNQTDVPGNNFRYCFRDPGIYTLTASFQDEKTGCSNSQSYTLKLNPKPKAGFNYSPESPVEGQDEVVLRSAVTGDKITRLRWFITGNDTETAEGEIVKRMFDQPGPYGVVLVAENEWTCADTMIGQINILPDFAIYIPNSFTPNGDKLNDVFRPSIRSARMLSMKIFNRWGQVLYDHKGLDAGWDGTFKGEFCKPDTYTWLITVTSSAGEEQQLQGQIILLH